MFSKILTILLGTFLVAVSLKYVKNAWWPIHQGNLRNWRNWALSLAIRTKFKLVLWSMLDRVTSWYYCIKKGTKIMYCTLEESLEPASHSQLFNLLEKLALLVLMVSQWDIQWSVTNNWSWKRPHYIVVSCSVQEALMPSVKLPAVTVVWVELIRKTLIELLHMQQTLLSILISLHNKLKKEELVVGTSCVKRPPKHTQNCFPRGAFFKGHNFFE